MPQVSIEIKVRQYLQHIAVIYFAGCWVINPFLCAVWIRRKSSNRQAVSASVSTALTWRAQRSGGRAWKESFHLDLGVTWCHESFSPAIHSTLGWVDWVPWVVTQRIRRLLVPSCIRRHQKLLDQLPGGRTHRVRNRMKLAHDCVIDVPAIMD